MGDAVVPQDRWRHEEELVSQKRLALLPWKQLGTHVLEPPEAVRRHAQPVLRLSHVVEVKRRELIVFSMPRKARAPHAHKKRRARHALDRGDRSLQQAVHLP